MGVPSSCGTRASCSTPRTGIMRCITVAAAVISILCMSEAAKCCRPEIVSIAPPASMPTPPVMPLFSDRVPHETKSGLDVVDTELTSRRF